MLSNYWLGRSASCYGRFHSHVIHDKVRRRGRQPGGGPQTSLHMF